MATSNHSLIHTSLTDVIIFVGAGEGIRTPDPNLGKHEIAVSCQSIVLHEGTPHFTQSHAGRPGPTEDPTCTPTHERGLMQTRMEAGSSNREVTTPLSPGAEARVWPRYGTGIIRLTDKFAHQCLGSRWRASSRPQTLSMCSRTCSSGAARRAEDRASGRADMPAAFRRPERWRFHRSGDNGRCMPDTCVAGPRRTRGSVTPVTPVTPGFTHEVPKVACYACLGNYESPLALRGAVVSKPRGAIAERVPLPGRPHA